MSTSIKFAIIQNGYAVFGTGSTKEEAISDAVNWMDSIDNPSEVEELIVSRNRANDGDFCILQDDDEEFDSYMSNQGGFQKIDGEWFSV